MLKVATSDTHPIYADKLPLPWTQVSGSILLTIAPGKQQNHSQTGVNWRRDVETDLNILIQKYSLNVLVSLLCDYEYDHLNIRDLPSKSLSKGIEFITFPIVDGSIPKSLEETLTLVNTICERLEKAKNVIVNCMGGLGRTGTIAACVFLRLSQKYDSKMVNPDEVIKKVRDARKGTINSSSQREFVFQFYNYLQEKS